MDNFFTALRKVIVGSMLVVFGFVLVYVPQPYNQTHEAEAALPVFDAAAVAALGVILGTVSTQTTKDIALDGIGWALGKSLISNMVSSLIDWINTGFEGSPAFVQDLDRFLLNVADEAAGEYIASLVGDDSFICSPFQLDIQIALALNYQEGRDNRPGECRLSRLTGDIEETLRGNFSQGGWQDFFEITSNPEEYTPYGQLVQAEAGLRASILDSTGEEAAKIDWGGGFLSGEICQMIEGKDGPKEKCVISKPGKIIQEALSFNLDTGRQTLIEADEINELVAALVGQLANQALIGTAGLLGLSAGTGYTEGDFDAGSYTDQINQDANDIRDASTPSVSVISDAIALQRDILQVTTNYITQLERFRIVTTDADKQEQAENSLEDAKEIVRNISRNIPILTEIEQAYRSLQQEYDAVGTSPERKNAIKSTQSRLLTRFYNLRTYSVDEFSAYERNWKSILN